MIFLNDCPIVWNSTKQKTVALSSAEAEYMAMSNAAQEVLWLLGFLKEIQMKIKLPVTLHCDNMSAIAVSKNDGKHQRTKHIEIRHHVVRDLIKEGTLQVTWVPTKSQVADVLTKCVTTNQFENLRKTFLSSIHEEQQSR